MCVINNNCYYSRMLLWEYFKHCALFRIIVASDYAEKVNETPEVIG